ncbi:hypothetical protein ACTSKR_07775 [Chitinibacteraceae bacterium HSL-7]
MQPDLIITVDNRCWQQGGQNHVRLPAMQGMSVEFWPWTPWGAGQFDCLPDAPWLDGEALRAGHYEATGQAMCASQITVEQDGKAVTYASHTGYMLAAVVPGAWRSIAYLVLYQMDGLWCPRPVEWSGRKRRMVRAL